VTVLVEGFDRDAIGLARFLAREGNVIRLAGRGEEPDDAAALERLGILIERGRDLDSDPGPADIAYLDVWTPEVAPRVERLRAQGTRISCLAELLLERWPGPTIGITGTAGKTTTTSLVASILRTAGIDVAVSVGARAGNLWPTGELLDVLLDEADATDRVLLLELTSSHLAFMAASPTIAAATCFWPDHLELHGSLAAYREAKETIVRYQDPTDRLVLDPGDRAVASFAAIAPGEIVAFSATGTVQRGAFVRSGVLTVRWDDAVTAVARIADPELPQAHLTSVLAAVTVALAAGAPPSAIADGLRAARPLPYRAVEVATIGGVPVVDDGLAATPAKASAMLAGYPRQSVVLIAGGVDSLEAGVVHAAPEEQPLFEQACDEIARAVRLAVVFGPAAARLEGALSARGVPLRTTAALDEAFELAAAATGAAPASTGGGVSVLLFSPLFPVELADRERFAALARAGRGEPAPARRYEL
jgi:UDP-N-acetylmuramoylalanine--D-glutamate ligase